MTVLKKTFSAILWFLLIVGFAACEFDMPKREKGTVVLTLAASESARTILPRIEADSYRISFSGPQSVEPVSTSETVVTIELQAGEWTISVAALNGEGDTVARGQSTGLRIAADETAEVSIDLFPMSAGEGLIDVAVTWPEGLSPGIDSYAVSLDGSAVSGGGVSAGSASVRYVAAVSSGQYSLAIILKSGAAERVSVLEAVQVYDNLASSARIDLTQADFTDVPAAPASLAAAEGKSSVLLSWTDSSRVEKGYLVERSADGALWELVSGELAANTERFSDLAAEGGRSYRYRVSAFNAIGASTSALTVVGGWAAPVPGGGGALSFGTATTNSVPVEWSAASDGSTPQRALEYMLVYSPFDNIGSAAEAAANGTAASGWIAAGTGATAAGLSAGKTYWFNVLARDGQGNTAAYAAASAAAAASPGSVTITVTVQTPQDQVIGFDLASDPVIPQTGTLRVAIAESFDSYAWALDGALLAGRSASSLELSCGSLDPGVHRVTAIVGKGGLTYSKTLRFTLEN